MARLKGCKRVTWGITGRLRDVIFRETKQGIIAAEYNKPAYSADRANTANAKVFGAVGRFGYDLKPMVDVGLSGLCENTYNANSQFVKKNYSTGTMSQTGIVTIAYPDIIVSEGSGKRFEGITAEINANDKLEITWGVSNLTEADAKTKCYFGIVCPTADRNVESVSKFSLGDTMMSSGSAVISVSSRWTNKKIYVYGFTRNEKGVVSSSQFLGEVTI